MAAQLSEADISLLKDKNVATVGDDGSPQLTVVWIDWDGQHILFNTEEKRAKVRHLRKDPRVAVCVFDAQNPYRYIEIRGRVVEITQEGAMDLIDRLAMKY